MSINWNQWKLTLPTGKPDEKLMPGLATYGDSNFHPTEDGSGQVFRASCGGATTSGSDYPRCELREMNGSKLASWSNTSGVTHQMTITQAITHLPVKKPHVVAGQIHDATGKICMIRLEGKKLFVESPFAADQLLDANYKLGTKFKVTIQATKSGVAIYYLTAGKPLVRAKAIKKTGSGWYFKAGCYTQSNTSKGDSSSAYGEVVIYDVKVTHGATSTKAPTTSKVTMSDSHINESSGFDYSTVHADLGYTLNDEPGQLFCIEPSTGKTVGTFKLPYALRDGEALRAPGDGYLYILDGGNNDLEYKTLNLYRIPEPGRGNHGVIPKEQCKRYVLVYPDTLKRNCEAMLFDPQLKRISIITKGSPNGRRFYLPHALYTTRTNTLIADVKAGELITDATYTPSGNYILAPQKKLPGKVTVYDRKLEKVDTITVDKLQQCESIAIHPSGHSFTIGSEGNRSPLVTKPIPTKYL